MTENSEPDRKKKIEQAYEDSNFNEISKLIQEKHIQAAKKSNKQRSVSQKSKSSKSHRQQPVIPKKTFESEKQYLTDRPKPKVEVKKIQTQPAESQINKSRRISFKTDSSSITPNSDRKNYHSKDPNQNLILANPQGRFEFENKKSRRENKENSIGYRDEDSYQMKGSRVYGSYKKNRRKNDYRKQTNESDFNFELGQEYLKSRQLAYQGSDLKFSLLNAKEKEKTLMKAMENDSDDEYSYSNILFKKYFNT